MVATKISGNSKTWEELVKVIQEEPMPVIAIQFVSWVIMPPVTSLLDAVVYLGFSPEARVWRFRGRAAAAAGNR